MLTTKIAVVTLPIAWQTAHRRNNANSNQLLRICEMTMENWPAIAMTSTPKRTGFRPTLEPKKLAPLQPSTARKISASFHDQERQYELPTPSTTARMDAIAA